MKDIVFDKAIFVELNLSIVGAGTELSFNDVPQLRGKFVQGIEAFTIVQVAKTPTQKAVIAAAAAKEMMMTFQQANEKRFESVPYYTLISSLNGGRIRRFNNLQVNINKSSVLIGGTTAVVGESLAFVVYYTDKPL